MDTLLDELALEIMAFLPTFEDRWQVSLVSRQWLAAYRLLLRPHNDALASRALHLPELGAWDSRGPEWTTWQDSHFMPPVAISFVFQGERILDQFGLYGAYEIAIYRGMFRLEISRTEIGKPWELEYPVKKKGKRRKIELPNPNPDGDVFDQVPRALAAFSFETATPEELDYTLPDETEWKSIRFNPVLARRLYNFPYFVGIRTAVEAHRAAEREKWKRRD
jgi:hypothetical protein